MSNETLFYVCGGILAVSAVTVSFLGLKLKGFPGRAMPIVLIWFGVFVVGAANFAVRYSSEEQEAKAAELEKAGEEIEEAEAEGGAPDGESEGGEGEAEEKAGASTTLQLAADPTALLFDKTELAAKPGKVTIDFDNPSAIPHNVVIEKDGEELAGFEPIAESKESVSADLEAGTYTFLCTVPGHAPAGMEGTLEVE
jgi:plastocyanin